ncbi:TspO/MBR related protein [Novosphingobium sp. PhB165]|uniref:TspO/MBR family protein n=1 Tax=Novosphingobium sp. PhB165 TaxID=2485105 RepID=UPI0010517F08|nr:TspO/MBR family protein [Novosphingobium sp. PhB165]TCM15048.1 TspO/MBR related protein [Novosphingobium sp. PhB165]
MNPIASPAQLRASLLRWSLVLVPLIVLLGFLSGKIADSGPGNAWFDALAKPGIYPPPITFAIVWTALYALMGLALAMVCAARGARGRAAAVVAFVVQFALNLAWSPIFFALHQMTVGLVVLGLMIVAVIVTMLFFARVRPVAALLLVPYLAWICFASYLNFAFLQLNRDMDGVEGPRAVERFEI